MTGFEQFLKTLQTTYLPEQSAFGWFHLLFLFIGLITCVLIFLFRNRIKTTGVKWFLIGLWIYFILDCVASQVVSSFNGVDPFTGAESWAWRYDLNNLPLQLCSASLFFYLPAALLINAKSKNGKLFRDTFMTFNATFLFYSAGFLYVYPVNVLGSNVILYYAIRTMIFHLALLVGGFVILATRQIKFNVWNFLKASVCFAILLAIAVTINEVYYYAYYVPKQNEVGVDLTKYTKLYVVNLYYVSAHFSFPLLDPVKKVFYYPQWYWVFILLYFIVLCAGCCVVIYVSLGCDKLSHYIFVQTDEKCPQCKDHNLVIWRHVGGGTVHCSDFPICHYTLKDKKKVNKLLNEYLKPKTKKSVK